MKYVSKLDRIDSIKIRFFSRTPYPEILEELIEENKRAEKQLVELKEIVEKITRVLNIKIEMDILTIKHSDSIHISIFKSGEKPNVWIKIPDKAQKLYDELKDKDIVEILEKLVEVAREERKKAEELLKRLVEEGLVTLE